MTTCPECSRRRAYMAADPEMYRGDDTRCEAHRPSDDAARHATARTVGDAFRLVLSHLAKVTAEREALAAAMPSEGADAALAYAAMRTERDEDAARLDWLERRIFESHWWGTIGEPPTWPIAGTARHFAARMVGSTFRDAIDAARAKEKP